MATRTHLGAPGGSPTPAILECMQQLRLALLWLVACHASEARSSRPAVTPQPVAPVVPEVLPLAAPHGGRIELIAITDRGDAVLTAGSFAEIRLWPTLDGTREPVVVRGPRAMQLALGRDRDGLLAAILDQAAGVTLVRFDARG